MALTDAAIERIKEMIVSGALQPGERLPKEDDLARTLGISRNSLREAVRALTLVRILDVRQGDGTYVTSLEPRLLLDAVSFVADFHRDDSVLYLIEVRRMLEPQATALAARRIKRADVERLVALVDEVDAASDVETLVANDLTFHRRIAEACGNPVLIALLDSVSVPTARARVWRGLTEDRALERTLAEHHEIVDALARHEPEIAAARAAAHISGLEDWLRKAL
jgi:DNA-binding FadR family transcriptional regulator